MSTSQDIGTRIRAARRERGLTQDDLADQVGVSRSAVAQWETGRTGQITGNLSRIADAENGVTNIKGAVLLGLWDAFKEHRIEMPFPQREVRIRDFPSAATVYGVAEPEITGEEVR